MQFLFLRFLIVCLALLPTTILQIKRNPFKITEIPTIVILGLLSQSSLALTFLGYQYATALDASIITLISPILSVAAGHYYFNEGVNKKTKIGVVLASLGTFLIIIEPFILNGAPIRTKELRVLGNLLILSATLAFLLYTIWSKFAGGEKSQKIKNNFKVLHLHKLKKGRSDLTIAFITFYIGLATTIPLVLLEINGFFGPAPLIQWSALPIDAILGILYMSLLSSIAAYTLFEWALNIVSVADTAFFNYLSPVFTLPAAYLLLGETPTKVTLVGAGIIALGVIIAQHSKS